MSNEQIQLVVNGELTLSRKDKHQSAKRESKKKYENLTYTTRMEKLAISKSNSFNLIDTLDIQQKIEYIQKNWNDCVRNVQKRLKNTKIGKLLFTGLFTAILFTSANTANAGIMPEYSYQVEDSARIAEVAEQHGVTKEQLTNINGEITDGMIILLPKVTNKIVTVDVLNVRDKDGLHGNVVAKVKKGAIVKVIETQPLNDGWSAILAEGRVYFVASQYIADNVADAAKSKRDFESRTFDNSPKTTKYTINEGDCLFKIAKRLEVSLSLLKDLNPDLDYDNLKVGQVINIPFSIPANSEGETNNSVSHETVMNTTTYQVKEGEYFYSIAEKLNISPKVLEKLNPGVNSTKLQIGQYINIPADSFQEVNKTTIRVNALIQGVYDDGSFSFIAEGKSYTGKINSDAIASELKYFQETGMEVELQLESKRSQVLTLITIH